MHGADIPPLRKEPVKEGGDAAPKNQLAAILESAAKSFGSDEVNAHETCT